MHFTDESLGTEAAATFIVANKVTRPILSGGDLNNQGNITISSAKGAFVVDEEIARELCESLLPHSKLSFSRAGPGKLYELDSYLIPESALFFSGAGVRMGSSSDDWCTLAPSNCTHFLQIRKT